MAPQVEEDVTGEPHSSACAAPANASKIEYLFDLDLKRLEHDASLAGFVGQAETLFKSFFEECGFISSIRTWSQCLVTLLLAEVPACEHSAARQELAGFVIYKHWGPPVRTMTLLRVAVDPKHRGFGFGRQLVKIVEDRARALPVQACGEVSLCALPEVVSFYKKMSYKEDVRDAKAMMGSSGAHAAGDGCDGVPGSVFMRRKCVRARGTARQRRR